MFLIVLSCLSDAHRIIVVARFLSMSSDSDSGTAIPKMEREWHGRYFNDADSDTTNISKHIIAKN